MVCSLCKKHNTKCRSRSEKWTNKPRIRLEKHALKKHANSAMHQEAEGQETASMLTNGGIMHALNQQGTIQHTAVLHAVKAIYWLVKEELPHMSTYPLLRELLESCDAPCINHLDKVQCYIVTTHFAMNPSANEYFALSHKLFSFKCFRETIPTTDHTDSHRK